MRLCEIFENAGIFVYIVGKKGESQNAGIKTFENTDKYRQNCYCGYFGAT